MRDVDFADWGGGTAEAYACGLPACVAEGFEDLSAQQACCACDEGARHDDGVEGVDWGESWRSRICFSKYLKVGSLQVRCVTRRTVACDSNVSMVLSTR